VKQIVVCGSIQFLNEMKQCADLLRNSGFTVVLPKEDGWESIKPEEINAYKRVVSKRHFDAIADSNTSAILVVNPQKKGLDNYIGANTFAEIAIAFYFGKKIYLLYDFYEPYCDELQAWGCAPMQGDFDLIMQ